MKDWQSAVTRHQLVQQKGHAPPILWHVNYLTREFGPPILIAYFLRKSTNLDLTMELKLWRIIDLTRLKARKAASLLFDQSKLRTKHWKIAPCKGIQDSLGFWIPRHDFQIPVTGFRLIFQWILPGYRIPDSLSCILDSRFHQQKFHFPRLLTSRISDPDSLERGEKLSTGCINMIALLRCALYDGHCIQSTVLSRFEMKNFHQFSTVKPS